MKKLNGHPRFRKLLKEMQRIHETKNSDYSEADIPLSNFRLSEKFGVEPYLGVLIRISDKYSRICQLVKNKKSKVDEKIEDTLIDMANYCLLMVILYEERNKK